MLLRRSRSHLASTAFQEIESESIELENKVVSYYWISCHIIHTFRSTSSDCISCCTDQKDCSLDLNQTTSL